MDLLTSVAARSPPLRKEFYDSSHFPQPHLDDYAHISPRIHHNTSFTNLHTLHQQDDNNNNNNTFLRHSGSSSSLVGMGLYHGTRRVSIDEVPAHVTASPLHSTAAISSTSSSSATSPSPHLIHHSTLHSPASPYMLYPPSPLHPHHHIPPLHPITGQPPSPLHMRTQPPSPLHSRSASPSSAFRTPHSTDFEMLKKQYIPITTAAAAHLKMMTQAAAANGIGINNVTAPTPVTVPTPIATPAAAAAAPTTRRKASPSSMDPATQAAVNAEADSIMAAVEAESEAREQKKRGRGRTATKEKPVKEKKSAKGKKKESEDSFEDGDAASISTSSTPKRRASPTPSAPNKRTKTHATDEERKKAKHREIDAHRRNREANALTTLQNLAFPDHPGRPEKAAVLIRSGQMLMDAQRDITSLRDKLDEMTRANEQLLAEKKIWEEQKMMYEIEREKGMVKKENKEEEIDIIPTKSRSVNNTALAELASYRDARSPLHHSLQRAFELGAASTMYQSMFVNASVIMCVMNTLGQCVDVNQRFVEKSGWARSDVIGRSLTSITAYSPLWTGSNDKVPRKMSSDELPVVKSPSSVSCMELPPYADTLKAILRLFKGKEQCVTCVHRMVDGWGRVVAVKANTWLVYEQGKIKYGICATTDENVTVVSESPSLALASPETSPSTSTSTPENQDSSNQTPTTTPTSSPAPATVTS